MHEQEHEAQLYIIATPIGNLKDMTIRALEVLQSDVSALFCEDTRVTGRLLSHFEIKLQLHSLHQHSSDKVCEKAIEYLRQGKSIGYASDCGTPGVSDPGSKLVSQVVKAGFTVVPLPGASALPAIVSVSGFPTKNVLFAGFISKKPGRRINELRDLASFKGTVVLYESCHRIMKTLAAIAEVFPEHNIVIGREMTKRFEEYIRLNTGTFSSETPKITEKGEFCIAIHNE